MKPLHITGFTLSSSLGVGASAHLEGLREGRSGLAPCHFETTRIASWVGQIADEQLSPLPQALARFECRNNRLARLALAQDDFEARVAQVRERYGARRVGVFLGTSTSGMLQTELAYRRRDADSGALPANFQYASTHNTFSLAHYVQQTLRLEGPAVVTSTACSSSAKVFGAAARAITAGVCDAAVVGGVDSLCLTTLYGFGSLELLAPGPCRPFDAERDGISIGEGAGFALLERTPSAPPANTVQVLGVGESSDAYHMSSPHPEGLGARMAMQRALSAAGLEPGQIDYVNLHGTATPANDAAEEKAMFDVFGPDTACSSTKGATGHLLGAAGVVEALICVLALQNRFLPGSPNTRTVDPATRVRYQLRSASATPRRMMSNSFGFGGTNCSLVLGTATA